jgi:hypothetical protein
MMQNKTFNGSDIFPKNTIINDKNNISINGVDLKDLAEEYGTPLYVYDGFSGIFYFRNSR